MEQGRPTGISSDRRNFGSLGDLIRHQVTEASNPARIGKEMLRTAEIKGRELHLKTPVESFVQATLVWERV